jgi:hypothetical protein
MQTYDIEKTQYKVADFLQWQKAGGLNLAPVFQRRSVWNAKAKSYLVDTVVRGLPTPIIFLRDRIDLQSMQANREVVDGQQRLRTLIGFIDPTALPDFDEERDAFLVIPTHNDAIAGKRFGRLDPEFQHMILNYSFSTHVIPSTVDDREILMIFERLNSTGQKLNSQELRNAEWFGEFKTLMYELALEQLERWRGWGLFSGDEIARMKEVELTSDMVLTMLDGLGAKSQARINRAYEDFDDAFPQKSAVERRFRKVMDSIEELLGDQIERTIFSREIWFVVLFVLVYRRLYGDTDLTVRRAAAKLAPGLGKKLVAASARVRDASDLPADVLDSIRGASSDAKSRRTRLEFIETAVRRL